VELLPASQPPQPALTFGRIDSTSPSAQQFVEIVNPLDYAVDVSNWKIAGSATATLKPGDPPPPPPHPPTPSIFAFLISDGQ